MLGIGRSSCGGSLVDGRVADAAAPLPAAAAAVVAVAAATTADAAAVADTLLADLERMAAEIIRFDTVSRRRVGGYAGKARAR